MITDMEMTEVTPQYARISGADIAGIDPLEQIQAVVNLMKAIDPNSFHLEDLYTFEQTFVGHYVRKLHVMIGKQRDYGPENITKAGERGIVVRMQDKVERLKMLLGDPDQQVKQVQALLLEFDYTETTEEMFAVIDKIDNVVNGNPSNESIEDTWLDASNYGDIGFVVREGAWPRPLQENL